jgi:hypothetical protein
MSRPPRIPERGDVAVPLVAKLLGMSPEEFALWRSDLERRGFPEPDPTTGLYCIEAVDRWRLRRYPKLFPELTTVPAAVDAAAVFVERMGRHRG